MVEQARSSRVLCGESLAYYISSKQKEGDASAAVLQISLGGTPQAIGWNRNCQGLESMNHLCL